jgi:hypothetical protein
MSHPDQGRLDECQCRHSALRIRSRRSASHPTQPFAATPMNDRFGTTVPLVCEAGIGAKQTLTHGAAAERPSPENSVRAEGTHHQWRKISPGELSIVPVADERPGWVTGLVEAS